MDRGEYIYIKRHFKRWLDVSMIIENIGGVSSKILDVGCGSGFFMLMFNRKIIGLDNIENVEICRRRGLLAYSVDLERERFPFKDNSFDIIICLEVIEHLKEPTICFKEMFRVLKTKGYLITSTPNNHIPIWKIRDLLFRFKFVGKIYMGRDLGRDIKRYCYDELVKLLFSYGFKPLGLYYSKIFLPRDDLLIISKKI